MKNRFRFTLLLCLLFSMTSYSQKEAKKGDYSFLKGEKSLNVEFDYSNMLIGKQLSEKEYLDEKVEKYNKDEAGRGDKWKESWLSDRENKFEPKFLQLINKSLEGPGIDCGKNKEANYTVIVHTTYTEPGFNVGVMSKPSSCNYTFTFIENDTKKEVASYILENVPGTSVTGADIATGPRIAESYAKAGKMLGAYIAKSIK